MNTNQLIGTNTRLDSIRFDSTRLTFDKYFLTNYYNTASQQRNKVINTNTASKVVCFVDTLKRNNSTWSHNSSNSFSYHVRDNIYFDCLFSANELFLLLPISQCYFKIKQCHCSFFSLVILAQNTQNSLLMCNASVKVPKSNATQHT